MILQVFTVYDSAVGSYLQPFFVRAKGEALRSFGDACNDEKNNFYRHANDYSLVYLGEYDDSDGAFRPVPAPVKVISAVECQVDRDFENLKAHGFDRSKSLPM